jgi:adenosine deaminase
MYANLARKYGVKRGIQQISGEAMTEYETPQWLIDMPKAELHCHLGGSMRLSTILDLADSNGIRLAARDEKELRHLVVYKERQDKSLAAYLDCIAICESVLVNQEAFSRAAYEVCEDNHAENVKLLELRFGPTNYVSETLRSHEIMEAVIDGLRRGARDFDMYTGLIICGIRTDPEATRKAAQIAVNFQRQGVVGFDLAGMEHGYRPSTLAEYIKPVFRNFLPVTCHAGEDDTVASIADALIYLNAQRIGHGVSLRESPKILDYMDQTRIALEICPTSNEDTGVVADLETHPLPHYYHEGLRIAICTDNRTISDTNLTNEYARIIHQFNIKRDDILKIVKGSFKAAFINSRDKKKLLDHFDTCPEVSDSIP